MNKFLLLIFFPFVVAGQSYAPAPGQLGSTAIAMDSSAIIYWASAAIVTRGPMDLTNVGLGDASYGTELDAVGPADGPTFVSLGDGGSVTLTFPFPIMDAAGPDFAVFENGFIDHYMELAFVEVSSDGINFFRFDGVSEIPTDDQVTNFTTTNCGYVHNLAGKYRVGFGTPFDLSELTGIPLLDIFSITHVRLIDVVGSIDPLYSTVDSQGNVINDPFTTPWESSGFDLDGVAVINSAEASLSSIKDFKVTIAPNPCESVLWISGIEKGTFVIIDAWGRTVQQGDVLGETQLDVTFLSAGMYTIELRQQSHVRRERILKQ